VAVPAGAQVALPPASTTTVLVHAASPAELHLPPVPRVVTHQGPGKVFEPVPQGTGGLPQPRSLPTTPLGTGGAGPAAPCDLRFFMDNAVAPTGAAISASTGEPNVAVHGDGVLYTANFFAARSSDSGMSWARYDPYTMFPASDGGFCCDQRTLLVRNPDMVIWLLEYGYSQTTQQGRLRIAFTRTQADLKNDSFFYFDLTPSTFGLPAGRFLDYSDIAYSNGHLYGSAIIASPPATAQGLVLWRARLFDIWDLGGVGLGFYTSTTLGGFGSYRFAQNSSDPMYWAAHTSTTNLRVFSWSDAAGAASQFDRTVAAWSGTPTAAAGPDGRDWTGFAYTMNTVLSGYVRPGAGEVGFLWTSGAVPPGRPQNFVRVARLRTSDLALVGQDDIWHGSISWHYPTCAVNAAGEVGGTIAFGGGGASGFYPSTAVFMVDQCSPNWAPLTNAAFATGARGPSGNRWGDYLGAGRHAVVTTTFVGAGFALDSTGACQPRFVWFGRERDQPGWVDASISAFDTSGTVPLPAAMTVAQTDRLARKDGVAPFNRSYPPRQALQVTAPRFLAGPGGVQHRFDHWVYEGIAQPAGQLTLSVGDLGTGPRSVSARALYEPLRELIVDATPASGVAITVSPPDAFANGDGSTPFQRWYPTGTVVALTAPAQVGNHAFRYWVVNGVAGPVNQTSIGVGLAAATTAVADFGTVIGMGTDWRDLTPASAIRPSPRYQHAMAYHAATGKVLLFGGGNGLADTWELDGDQWTQLAPTTAPPGRTEHAMAYDIQTPRTVMFGGRDAAGQRLADTWAYDGTDWSDMQPVTSPSPRYGHALAFDVARDVVLLFGGNVAGGAFGTLVADTWSFDGTTWTLLAPATVPPALTGPSMVYDARRGVVVLVGSNGNLNSLETWEWNGTDWTAMAPATVPPARTSDLVYDSLRGKVVLFSGQRLPSPLRDTWEWDGIDWRQRFTPNAPPFRAHHAMVYDDQHHRSVVFGGFTQPFTSRDDTWEYTFACEIVGEGIPGGGALPIGCTSPPQIGQSFCVEFPNAQHLGVLLIGLSPPLYPPLPLDPPTFCAAANLFALPDVSIPLSTDPASLCLPVPPDPALAGALLTMQGMALEPATCFTATDGMAVILQR